MRPPEFFARVRAEAATRCDLLARDPVLAAPGLQLFKQIQNPRFVLSELLQNADDVGARSVRSWCEDGVFHFEHDGADFSEVHLVSLCRFGFSNKRHLHTIGFRGLGFKSVFSYGPIVRLQTPTLSLHFDEERFTEPVWDAGGHAYSLTHVSVRFRSAEVGRLAQAELERWAASPVPLLFFRSITALDLAGQSVRKVSLGVGPVTLSEWVKLEGTHEGSLLVVRTPLEALPDDAIEEVRGERMDPEFVAAEASVQLVLGLREKDRLYAVLPTTVEWDLPFSVNAPFVQDPTRTAIKDPVMSPLNRWLLERTGQLAADTLSAWVGRSDLPIGERAESYELLGAARLSRDTVGGSAASEVVAAMRAHLSNRPILLTTQGQVVAAKRAVDVPGDLADVWDDESACAVLGQSESDVLHVRVPAWARDNLRAWEYLERLDRPAVIERLSREGVSVPRPSWEGLVNLWAYLEAGTRGIWNANWLGSVHVVPVLQGNLLSRMGQAVVLGDALEDVPTVDQEFLSKFLPLADGHWTEAVSTSSSEPRDGQSADKSKRVADARSFWTRLGLGASTSLENIVARVAEEIRTRGTLAEHGVELARIAARHSVAVPAEFPYLTLSGTWRVASEDVVDIRADLIDLLPDEWLSAHQISARYEEDLSAEELRIWRAWTASPKSRLRRFVSPGIVKSRLYSRKAINNLYHVRGGADTLSFPYVRDDFVVVDHDVAQEVWDHWTGLCAEDAKTWLRIVEGIGANWANFRECTGLELRQEGTRYYKTIDTGDLPAAWLHRLRALACLPDDFGQMEHPSALLRHTANTAFLHGIEPFVHPDIDRSELHEFLDDLGVRSDPSDADIIVERLLVLARLADPPEEALLRLYATLDRLIARLPGDRAQSVVAVFATEAIIRTQDGGWSASDGVFIDNAEQLPGVAIVWKRGAQLGLWRQVGVEHRPTADMVLGWLRERAEGERVEGAAKQRVRALLGGMPERAWTICRAWLDLDDRWMPVSRLRYRTARPSVWQRVFPAIRSETADLSMLAPECPSAELFHELASLDDAVEMRALSVVRHSEESPQWLAEIAKCIQRIRKADLQPLRNAEGDLSPASHPDHAAALTLRAADWVTADELQVVPHIEGRPVGPFRTVHAAWTGQRIIVKGKQAIYYRELVEVLAARFTTSSVRDAIAACVGRDSEWVEEYFSSHFRLEEENTHEIDIPGPIGLGALEAEAHDRTALPVTVSTRVGNMSGEVEYDSKDNAVENDPRSDAEPLGQAPDRSNESPLRVREHHRVGPYGAEALVSILETFGYQVVAGLQRLIHPDGGWAELEREGLVHAIAYADDGTVRAYFWESNADIAHGFEMSAEAWSFLERFKGIAWIVVPEGDKVTAHMLKTLEPSLEIFPALYHLRCRSV